jgi:hypothetical protein
VKNRHCNLISYILAAGVLLLGIFIAFFIYQETAPKDYVVITSPLFDKESRDEGRTWFQKEEAGESITLDTVQDFLETDEYLLVQGGIGTWIIHLYDRTDTLYNPALTDEEIRGINQGIADRDRHHLSAIKRLHSYDGLYRALLKRQNQLHGRLNIVNHTEQLSEAEQKAHEKFLKETNNAQGEFFYGPYQDPLFYLKIWLRRKIGGQ